MDRPLIANPNDYEGRPVAGITDWRGLATSAMVLIVVAPIAWCMWTFRLSVYLGSALAAVAAAPIGYVGLARFKGLRAEQFLPIVVRERRKPREMCWECPQPTFAGDATEARGRHEERAALAEWERQEWEDHLWALELAGDDGRDEA